MSTQNTKTASASTVTVAPTITKETPKLPAEKLQGVTVDFNIKQIELLSKLYKQYNNLKASKELLELFKINEDDDNTYQRIVITDSNRRTFETTNGNLIAKVVEILGFVMDDKLSTHEAKILSLNIKV